MEADDIKKIIEHAIENAQVFVDGDGRHFDAIVISPVFEGKSPVKKQQLVYATVADYISNGSIHALSIKTFTPEQWDKQS